MKLLGKKPIRHLLRWVRIICIVYVFLAVIAFVDSWHTYQWVINVPSPDNCVVTIRLYEEGIETGTWEIQGPDQKEYFLNMIAQLKYGGFFLPLSEGKGAHYTVDITNPSEKNYGARLIFEEHGGTYDMWGTSTFRSLHLRYSHSENLFLEIGHFLSANGIEDAEG